MHLSWILLAKKFCIFFNFSCLDDHNAEGTGFITANAHSVIYYDGPKDGAYNPIVHLVLKGWFKGSLCLLPIMKMMNMMMVINISILFTILIS